MGHPATPSVIFPWTAVVREVNGRTSLVFHSAGAASRSATYQMTSVFCGVRSAPIFASAVVAWAVSRYHLSARGLRFLVKHFAGR